MNVDTVLPPSALICIPPAIASKAQALAQEDVHPAWRKLHQRGKHYVVQTTSLDDISEIADWARTALVEPAEPLSKTERQAFQALVNRAGRFAEIEELGPCHCLAVRWREGNRPVHTLVSTSGTIKEPKSYKQC